MRQEGMAKELEVPSERHMVFKPGITIQDQSVVDAARICTGVWNEPGVRQDTDATGYKYYVPHLEEADEEHEPEFELEYVTWGGREKGETIYYGMSDLTVGSWVQLGQRLGQGEKQLRRVFKRHMYVGAGDRGRA
jgi:hypothetical protein